MIPTFYTNESRKVLIDFLAEKARSGGCQARTEMIPMKVWIVVDRLTPISTVTTAGLLLLYTLYCSPQTKIITLLCIKLFLNWHQLKQFSPTNYDFCIPGI